MRKDIFIDTNIAALMTNPISESILELKNWLNHNDETDKPNCAVLVLSQKMMVEYIGTSDYSGAQNMSVLIDLMRRQGRTNEFSNKEIKGFQNKYYKKSIKLRSGKKDQNHIPIVLMSDRKMALTLDKNFKYDLENFPKYKVIVENCPTKLSYR